MAGTNKSCDCTPEVVSMLKIKWKRLLSKGETCPRCGSTEDSFRKAESTLKLSRPIRN
jgi:hypothetical protein